MENKIGILTWHYYGNFGSSLQAFALQKTIQDLGYDVNLINYRNPLYDKRIWWRILLKKTFIYTVCLISKNLRKKYINNVKIFQERYLKQTKRFTEPEILQKEATKYTHIVYGSDQIWAPNVYSPIYMGAYVPENVKKVSYAASIGLNDIPNNLIPEYKRYLSSFHTIGIREKEGKALLYNKCGIDSTVVLDPTLLVSIDTYLKMQRPVDGIKEKFIFCYFLNKEHKYREKVIEYAQKHNLHIIGVSDKPSDSEWMQRLTNVGADQFLWLINNSEVIFTDSYHGSIFSLLFHKNLWIFIRFAEENQLCQNSRIRQLQDNFNLSHRVVTSEREIDDTHNIDYDYFDKKLATLKEESLSYLKNALK